MVCLRINYGTFENIPQHHCGTFQSRQSWKFKSVLQHSKTFGNILECCEIFNSRVFGNVPKSWTTLNSRNFEDSLESRPFESIRDHSSTFFDRSGTVWSIQEHPCSLWSIPENSQMMWRAITGLQESHYRFIQLTCHTTDYTHVLI